MTSRTYRYATFHALASLLFIALAPAPSRAALVLSGGGLTLVSEGGGIGANNLATSGTAFALDELDFGTHFIPNVNDGTFGNPSSWIGLSGTQVTSHGARGLIGIALAATEKAPYSLSGFAFGRDNTGTLFDRDESATPYVLQYTQVVNPDETLLDTGNAATGWDDIGTLTYGVAGGTNYTAPHLRHEYSFDPVIATGLRLLVPAVGVGGGTAIDEFEIFGNQLIPEPSTFLLMTFAMLMAGSRRLVRARRKLSMYAMAALLLIATLAVNNPVAHAGVVITPASAFSVTWDGNDGDFFNAAAAATVPTTNALGRPNQALASVGATPFSDGELGSGHVTTDLNNGLYGNSDSWISDGDAATFAGIDFAGTAPLLIKSIAWSRDNGNNVEAACGGQCTDRNLGVYTLERTLVLNPDATTAVTGNASTGWETVATIDFQSDDDGILGGGFTGYYRHEFLLGAGVYMTGFRLNMSATNIALDELEAFSGPVPEPSTLALLGLGFVALATRRRRK